MKELREDCDERLEKTITEMVRKVDDLEGRTKRNNLICHSMMCESREVCVLFSSFTASCYDLTSKAKKAVLCIMQKLRMLNNNSFKLFLKLFDSQVQPITLYWAELRQQLFTGEKKSTFN